MNGHYQKLTESIAEDNGLPTSLRPNFDPIYNAQREGEFVRRLSKRGSWMTNIAIGIFFLLGPILVFGSSILDAALLDDMLTNGLVILVMASISFIVACRFLYIGITKLVNKSK